GFVGAASDSTARAEATVRQRYPNLALTTLREAIEAGIRDPQPLTAATQFDALASTQEFRVPGRWKANRLTISPAPLGSDHPTALMIRWAAAIQASAKLAAI